jgi:hypothetical protein
LSRQAEQVTSTTSGSATSTAVLRSFGGILFVLAVAAVVGALTPYAQVHLPESINAVANSSGSWVTITFTSIYLSRARGVLAAILGAASFLVMNLFFYDVFEQRIGLYLHQTLDFWIVVGLVVGPVIGLCASWLRSPNGILRAIAVAAPTSVLVGEGLYMLAFLRGVSTVYAISSVIVGIVVFVALSAWRLRHPAHIALSLGLCGISVAVFCAV